MNRDYLIYGGVALAALAAFWWVKKNGIAGVAAAGVGAVADAGAGAVLGIGDVIGVPRTDLTECEKAKAEGRWWDASFACPAANFLGGAWDAITGKTPETGGASGSWDKPSTSGYDYGTSGPGGIPWSYNAKPLPDIYSNNPLGYLFK